METIKYNEKYIKEVMNIWNDTIKEGIYFPQIETLNNEEEAHKYFSSQDYTGISIYNEKVLGVYILHPNNIGRCGHISNASYAVSKEYRGRGIGEILVRDSIKQAAKLGYKILQFNAVVISNTNAHKLYEKIRFNKIGIVKNGYMNKNNEYEDIVLYYIDL
ncbi:GNAT family N-acetyltransferase [Brachyspira hyodysenteriae]|uniref:GNAT family N-acetyltransferase n=1 Tax=Brachyspira hyodysenteriae TaxID=159 RepID=UPI001183C3A2|nr:GNAT family N-acetyltransferase [Brachyspira hyodysenteriae]TVL56793.1 GCN5 family acetyltransferase [Brachyspira hyodysenteriae]TVL63537.1 GCN5 family acetyltransferase [Brachyspira hyodysenteriae]TVL71300.1 GCN5 family acetyltransferase [Brachyspira hyodysenteriae]TVL73991.1 GCN5 family acetyltransferase [Brachyspira hyodysenteriae]TVL79354.1 GCN5 family acetyltransferase [Brachyspira hyodysenteriae]